MLFISVLWPTNHLAVFICQRSSNLSGKCIIHYFSDFSKWWDFDDTLSKFQIKSCVIRFSIDIRSTCLVKMLFYKVNKVLKKLLLTILCNCQENTSAGAPFIIRISWSCRPATIFVKKETLEQVTHFLKGLQNFSALCNNIQLHDRFIYSVYCCFFYFSSLLTFPI